MPSNTKNLLLFGHRITILWILALVCYSTEGLAQSYETRVVVSGLSRPTGIEAKGSETLFFTQLPTPGVSGMNGAGTTFSISRRIRRSLQPRPGFR